MKIAQFYCLLVLYTFMGLSRSAMVLTSIASDKLLHFSGYAVFIISAMLAYGKRRSLVFLFVLLFAYSILIECVQYFLPYRSFEVKDILANLAGLAAGSVIWFGITRYIDKTPSNTDDDAPAN